MPTLARSLLIHRSDQCRILPWPCADSQKADPMNISIISKIVVLCDELGRHSINCASPLEAEKLGRRLRNDQDFASKMLRLCRPAEPETRSGGVTGQ